MSKVRQTGTNWDKVEQLIMLTKSKITQTINIKIKKDFPT